MATKTKITTNTFTKVFIYITGGMFVVTAGFGIYLSGNIKVFNKEAAIKESGAANSAHSRNVSSISSDRVLVAYSADWPEDLDNNGTQDSLQVAEYYMQRRGIPIENIISLPITDVTSYNRFQLSYDRLHDEIITPLKEKLAILGPSNIDVILLCYGLPYKTVAYAGTDPLTVSVDNAVMGLYRLVPEVDLFKDNNPYFEVSPIFNLPDKGHFNHDDYKYGGQTMYLVSRLDGPNGVTGTLELIDQALYGEQYISAQDGYYNGIGYADSYGEFGGDEGLANDPAVQNGWYSTVNDAAKNIAWTEHFVVEGEFPLKWEVTSNEIGEPGAEYSDSSSAEESPEQPLFYGGWYVMNEDVWDWLPGSLGIDLNSYSLSDLKTGTGYMGEGLVRGLTGTSGVINEPYVNGHARPHIFMAYIVRGYPFVEAAMLATPYLGWMAVNIGDPLYTPLAADKPLIYDTQEPVISSGYPVLIGEIDSGSRVVSVKVDDSPEPEVVKVSIDYGVDTDYEVTVDSGPGYFRRHEITLPDIDADTIYHYRLTLEDPVGNITVSDDYNFSNVSIPAIESVKANQINEIDVAFSETMDRVSAETVSNYSIDQGITVSSASLSSDERTVTLSTAPLTPGTIYTLTVNNVADLAGHPVNPNTQATFFYAARVYRSVGPGNTAALAIGASNALSISNFTASFILPLPDNVGVGDAIQYDSSGDGIIDTIAFISSRISSTEYVLTNSLGGTPDQVSGDSDWSIFRAYTSLTNAESGSENSGIDSSVSDFDSWTDGKDLVSAGEIRMIACYADAIDTERVDVNGWTTSQEAYLKIFAPVAPNEVGVTQRHNGIANEQGYKITNGTNWQAVIKVSSNNVQIEGLWVESTGDNCKGISTSAHITDTKIFGNLVSSVAINPGLNSNVGISMETADQGHSTYVTNNIVIGYGTGIYVKGSWDSFANFFIYNNTAVRNINGVKCYHGADNGSFIFKNNLVADNTSADWYQASVSTGSTHNSSSDDTVPEEGIYYADAVVTFIDESNNNYHLDTLDTGAKDKGTNLSEDEYYAFSVDVDVEGRTGIWDIGADEALGGQINQPPSVDAGYNQEITWPIVTVSLDGTVDDDNLPAVATLWEKVGGDGEVSFGDPSAIDTTASFSEAGAYELRLTADDGEFQISDIVTIIVHEAPTPGGSPVMLKEVFHYIFQD
ncbi:Ig-like domain-containing protein [Patescibacteria group bacterium]|nr:Ig-like domain-containing protein [Patescibacteria group bacterium]MBU1889871.1 Ig-like domain-containing protein [Patescibacteria group bacterium]